jgi:hypothetical protein
MLVSSAQVRYHASMLRDSARTKAFRSAIEATVKPGDVVCDIGTGTAILSLFALRAGARKVYAIEAGPIVQAARHVVRDNGQDRVEVLHGRSTELALPERADVVVSETLWNAGVGEGIVATFQDARDRLGKPGAAVIPASFEVLIAPVESERAYHVVGAWTGDSYGTDLRSIRSLAVNAVHLQDLTPEDLLAHPQPVAQVDLTRDYTKPSSMTVTFETHRAGILHGLGSWFRSQLAPGVMIENHPGSDLKSWQHAFLPIDRPVSVDQGAIVEVKIWLAADGEEWQWIVTAGGVEQRQATLLGQLRSFERLHRSAPERRPTLSPEGRALAELINAVDERRPESDLAPLLLERLPDHFTAEPQAAAFVRRVLTKWTT